MTRSSRSSSAVAAAPTVARYAVVGNPIQHSLSPQIHALFADKCRQQMTYEKLLAPLDGFEEFALSLRELLKDRCKSHKEKSLVELIVKLHNESTI